MNYGTLVESKVLPVFIPITRRYRWGDRQQNTPARVEKEHSHRGIPLNHILEIAENLLGSRKIKIRHCISHNTFLPRRNHRCVTARFTSSLFLSLSLLVLSPHDLVQCDVQRCGTSLCGIAGECNQARSAAHNAKLVTSQTGRAAQVRQLAQ